MTLSDYIIFTTVSELKNMSLASDKLYLTRSAISHAISRIEREIGFPLFIKNTHGIELTDNGAALPILELCPSSPCICCYTKPPAFQ